eukprot:g32226.t1
MRTALYKTITWRICMILMQGSTALTFTRDWEKASKILGIQTVLGSAAYYLHEKAWDKRKPVQIVDVDI